MKLRQRVLLRLAAIVRGGKLVHYYRTRSDERVSPPFKLVFYCGEKGLSYLNASLISVYKFWKKLPEICIISDGAPADKIRNGLIKWPKNIEIFSWEDCALSLKEKLNIDLYNYASNSLVGRKLVGLIYCAEKFPILYSDSDVLWFNSPAEIDVDFNVKPQIKMSQDIGYFYTKQVIEHLQEEKCQDHIPFNSGVMYLNGEFSSFPKWKCLCEFLNTNKDLGWFSEQTTFAILTNYFNPDNFFKPTEVLIKIDDELSLEYTGKLYPDILARHYVNVKATTFWRDLVFMFFKNKN